MTEQGTFDQLGLDSEILSAIAELGFVTPTPVQAAVIPRLLGSQRDIVGLAQTGTGKTAAFGLPIIQRTDVARRETQVLILCPTRELCLQIARDLTGFCKHKKGIRILAVYGGSSIETQITALNRGVHIIVATPGRIHDLLRRKRARLEAVSRVVLDEADEMLNMGFQEDLEAILEQVPDSAQTLLFSATMPNSVATIARKYMHDAEEITIGRKNAGAENVTHVCYTVHARDRYLAVKRIVDSYPDMYGIVFCRTRIETQEIADKLMKDGYNADSLHGDLTQSQRDRVMDKFRTRELQMLVATDVAARGLDVTDLTHIINYNLPADLESYTHRSGRTGRAGKTGMSMVIIHMRERALIGRIEQMLKKKFEFRELPTGAEVCAAQLLSLIGRVKKVKVDHTQIDKYLPQIEELLAGMSREDLIRHFVSLEFNRFLDYYRNAPDLNAQQQRPQRAQGPDRDRAPRDTERRYCDLRINLGRRNGLSPRALIQLVNDALQSVSTAIGHIDIQESASSFQVDFRQAARLMSALGEVTFGDRAIRVEPAENTGQGDAHRQNRRHFPRRGGTVERMRAQERVRNPGREGFGPGGKAWPHKKGHRPHKTGDSRLPG